MVIARIQHSLGKICSISLGRLFLPRSCHKIRTTLQISLSMLFSGYRYVSRYLSAKANTFCRARQTSNTSKSSKKSAASLQIRTWTKVNTTARLVMLLLIGETIHLGFILDKSIGVNCPKRIENTKILIANTCTSPPSNLSAFLYKSHRISLLILIFFTTSLAMDTDKIKIFGAKVKVDGTSKLAELERAEKDKMKAKVQSIAGKI